MQTYALAGKTICELDATGEVAASESDFGMLAGQVYGAEAEWTVVPFTRLAPEFFDLKSKLAGLLIQKFVNYRMKVAFLGDVSTLTTRSKAWHDFVYETNRGGQVLFAADRDELARLIG